MTTLTTFLLLLAFCIDIRAASRPIQLSENNIIPNHEAPADQNLIRLHRQTEATILFQEKIETKDGYFALKYGTEVRNLKQINSLVALLIKIAIEYLEKCPPVIYYDKMRSNSVDSILKNMLRALPVTHYHGEINRYEGVDKLLHHPTDISCKSYIFFLSDPLQAMRIIGPQMESRVVIVTTSKQWKVRDFLSSSASSNIVNLLLIAESLSDKFQMVRPYVLYTHKLYTDGLGSNIPVILASWINGALSLQNMNLFPPKLTEGFAGHRFQVSASSQPPFIFRLKSLDASGGLRTNWDGIEYRLLNLIAGRLNFSFHISEPEESIIKGYRAIMGPFQWPVWISLIFVYMGAVFPIVFTDRLTLNHLIGNWSETENMFWYVFGMFTNSFTLSGKYSWMNSQRISTRILIGFYWIFTIIITACYTGSIISFVTMPRFPDTVDSVDDLLGLFFKVGTLDRGGWQKWFLNSTDEKAAKLLAKMEYVSSLEEGIHNVTQSFFWKYSFLGSRAQLEYLVQSNFTQKDISRRSALHLSDDCFALFQIGYLFPKNSVYKEKINKIILLAKQSGLMLKIQNDVSWTMQRSPTNKLLQVSKTNSPKKLGQEERQLTMADTEGMFLLLGIGYFLSSIVFISEMIGGFTNKCRLIFRRGKKSIPSNTLSSNAICMDLIENEQNENEVETVCKIKAIPQKKRNHFGSTKFSTTQNMIEELYDNSSHNKKKFTNSNDEGKDNSDSVNNLPSESFVQQTMRNYVAVQDESKIDETHLYLELITEVSIEPNIFGSFIECSQNDGANMSKLDDLGLFQKL